LALGLTLLVTSGMLGCSGPTPNAPNTGSGMMNRGGTSSAPANVPRNTPGGMMNNTTGY
jgi:hypothetical protein